MSNNYTGELVGIQIALEFLSEIDHSDLVGRSIHLFTDCQPAIISAFDKKPPTSKIEIVTKMKECCNYLCCKGNSINVHWVPGYQDIRGNELADKQAKEAAAEVSGKVDIPIEMDKKEAVSELKRQVKEKWSNKKGRENTRDFYRGRKEELLWRGRQTNIFSCEPITVRSYPSE